MKINKHLTVGILGVGEVGQAISTIVSKKYSVLHKDINQDEIKRNRVDVLHICIPYSPRFNQIVLKQIKVCQPQLAIIESTVSLKTTETIAALTQTPIVHSPIRGSHPNLAPDLKKFIKFIGSSNRQAAKLAKQYYATLGIKAKILKSSRETELGKLLSTTYYALSIAWHQEMARLCQKHQISFNQAVTQFNLSYNQGYKQSKPQVIRPVLTPGYIGGHCLIPNIKLLKQTFKSDFLDTIIKSNQKTKASQCQK